MESIQAMKLTLYLKFVNSKNKYKIFITYQIWETQILIILLSIISFPFRLKNLHTCKYTIASSYNVFFVAVIRKIYFTFSFLVINQVFKIPMYYLIDFTVAYQITIQSFIQIQLPKATYLSGYKFYFICLCCQENYQLIAC